MPLLSIVSQVKWGIEATNAAASAYRLSTPKRLQVNHETNQS